MGAVSDDASLFIAKGELALSEADSDDRRKRLSSELRKAFDQYLNKNNNDSNNNNDRNDGLASHHNVEFETISNNSSKGLKPKLTTDTGSIIGKRKAPETDTIKDELSAKDSVIGDNPENDLIPVKKRPKN